MSETESKANPTSLDEIPAMPTWFEEYLRQLPVKQRDEVVAWMNCGDDAAVLDTIGAVLEGA